MTLSNDKKVDLLVALLDCDPKDLTALEGCRIPMLDIVEKAAENAAETGAQVDFNTLIWAMHVIAQEEVQDYISSTVDSYRFALKEGGHPEIEGRWLKEAVTIGENLNFFWDTGFTLPSSGVKLRFIHNADKYKKYFESALDHFESLTGYRIEDVE